MKFYFRTYKQFVLGVGIDWTHGLEFAIGIGPFLMGIEQPSPFGRGAK